MVIKAIPPAFIASTKLARLKPRPFIKTISKVLFGKARHRASILGTQDV